MSGSGDSFGEDIAALENVQRVESTAYLHEYTGVLAETDEKVIIGTLAPELTDIEAAVTAFTQVSDRWYNASANANILTIRDRGTEPRPWIAVPNHSGETLAAIQPDLSPDVIETVITQTAEALRTLGLYNTVHGHLSPNDIYVADVDDESEQLTVEVGGFGLEAAVRAAVGEAEPTAYTAPELLDGANQHTEQSDVYGLGAATYFVLTGQAPIAGSDLHKAINDGPTTPPSTYADGIGADVDDVVMRALSARSDDRYESPYAFHRAFLSVFEPSELGSADTGEADDDGADTADSAESADATPDEGDDGSPSDEKDDSAESDDTDETSVTRRAAVGLLGLGALGGAGWYLSRGQLNTPTPAEPIAMISVSPSRYSVGEKVTFSAAKSTTGEGVSLVRYEWAVGADDEFTVGEETLTHSFGNSGEQTVRLQIIDSEDRTDTVTTTVTVEPPADGAPMFQYDNANTGTNSSETGPQTSISEQWSYQAERAVGEPPAVVSGTVYVEAGDGVYALSAANGTEQWSAEIGEYMSSSPAVVDGTVYVGSDDGNVYALSADDGTEQWSFQAVGDISSSPAVAGGTVYVGSKDGSVYAVSADDGSEQWSYETEDVVSSSPAVANGTIYVGSSDNKVYALSTEDGTEYWAYQTSGSITYSSPAVVDDTVYVGSSDNNVYALSAEDGTEQWSFQTGKQVFSSPAVVDGTVYIGGLDSNVYALSAENGTEQWSFHTGESGGSVSSPAVVDDTVYVGNEANTVYALDGQDGTKQWSFRVGGPVYSPPVVVDNTVFVGTAHPDDTVYALSDRV